MSGNRESSSTQTTQPEPTSEELAKQKEEADKEVEDAIMALPEDTKTALEKAGSSAREKRGKQAWGGVE